MLYVHLLDKTFKLLVLGSEVLCLFGLAHHFLVQVRYGLNHAKLHVLLEVVVLFLQDPQSLSQVLQFFLLQGHKVLVLRKPRKICFVVPARSVVY